MKKLLLFLIIIISLQIASAQNVVYGVKGGLNYSKYIENFDSAIKYKSKLGYQIGGFVKIELTNNLFVQPELLFILQGTKFDINLFELHLPQEDLNVLPSNASNVKINESNIVLPVMLKYYIINNLNVEIGPQLDYMFWVSEENIEFRQDGSSIVNDSGSTSDFNFGLNLGAGYDFNEKAGVGLRYNYGFNRLFKGELSEFNNGYKLRNSIFQLSFEYRFN